MPFDLQKQRQLSVKVHLAKRIKKDTEMVVRTVGMIKDPFEANNIVINKDADMVAMARAFLSNPRWVWDARPVKLKIYFF